MGFFKKFLKGTKKDKEAEKSLYIEAEKTEKEIAFAHNFTEKGGKFIYSESKKQTIDYFNQILDENSWTNSDLTSNSDSLISFFGLTNTSSFEKRKSKVQLLDCEYLIANKGSILICNKQIKTLKLNELPDNLIILAGSNQFAEDVSDAMTLINTKYKENLPSNITTLNAFDATKKDDFLFYGSSTKNLYLLVQESF